MIEPANDQPLMDRYVVTVSVPMEFEVRGCTIDQASVAARNILQGIRTHYPAANLMRIMNDVTYVALEPASDEPRTPKPPTTPRGSPPSGGSPGTPVAKVA